MVRLAAFEPWELVPTMEMRGFQWRDNELVKEEIYILKNKAYFRSEVFLMLKNAGFDDIWVQGTYAKTDANEDDEVIVFLACKS